MAEFSFAKAFKPGGRADARTFQIALALVALLDAVRLTAFGALAAPAWLLVLVFLSFALSNRLRDAGRGMLLALVPIAVAIAAKTLFAFIAIFTALFPDFMRFLEERGVDLEDPAALQAAGSDPSIQSDYEQRLMQSPELMQQVASAGEWPSTWAFWIVIALFAIAWSRWPGRPYAVGGRR